MALNSAHQFSYKQKQKTLKTTKISCGRYTRINLVVKEKMELRYYIEQGEREAGGRKQLAEALEQNPNAITGAKAHRQGLPNYACVKLADLIGADRLAVIAASELVTEKLPGRRAVWHPFVEGRSELPICSTQQNVHRDRRSNDRRTSNLPYAGPERRLGERRHEARL